ncbi:aminoglycoside phosphotransferase family protein [Rhodovulum sp. YNF3179]|uniref:aminoglycoside phosphotransferase family protein n=1 Tax=Rhodovulum sp. YNF3179 TaxID=3425127 RepID=UPI003D354673
MADRAACKHAFLERAGWADAARAHLAGDASNRSYARLRRGAQSAVLMDAPPARGEDIRPFTRIARHLARLGLSAPAILAEDPEHGFLLLEDLGDALFSTVAEAQPELEETLYAAAVGVLAELHAHPVPPGIAAYDPPLMAGLSGLVLDWYLPAALGHPAPESAEALRAAVEAATASLATDRPVLVLRDYHAQNLIWLPERQGPARVGLLDFQDAMAGHPAYDLVSLLEDARRDTSAALRAAMYARYATETGTDPESLARAVAILGAQRNLRILGVFARLCLRDGKPGYVDLMPRVWDHLQRDLAHPALAALRAIVDDHLPAPDPDLQARMKAQCPAPTP